MAGLTLSSDEYVLSELQNAQDGQSVITKLYNVTLTNKRIIASKVGAFGKAKVAYEKPLSEVKAYDGSAQVKVSTVNGVQTKIDIYLSSGQLSFKLNGAGNTDALQFANELNHAVTDSNVDLYSLSGNPTGMSAFKKAFMGVGSFEAKKTTKEKVAVRCSGCGASFEGVKGGTAKCPFCGSVFNT